MSKSIEPLESISVVIPTRNRAKNVEKLLNEILNQTTSPKEVIIVDDSDNAETESIVHNVRTSYSSEDILLEYARGKGKKRSISAARNIGIKKASGDIILFIDDDVLPYEDSFEQLINCYRRHPDALGVAGYVSFFGQVDFFSEAFSVFSNSRSILSNTIKKTFFLTHMEKGKQRILRSGYLTFPYNLSQETNCDWSNGLFTSYKAEILRIFKFDEKLIKYSLWEDVDLAFRINKKYPNSLYLTPFAKVIHEKSPLERMPSRLLTYALVSYHTYFFFKNMPQNLLNRFAFAWSSFGMFFLRLLLLRDAQSSILLLRAYRYTLRYLGRVIDGRFPFLN